MKIVNLVLVATTILITGLLYSILITANPLDQKYDQLVEQMMEEEALASQEELLLQHPELVDIKQQIETARQLRYYAQQSSWQPISPDEAQSLQLMQQRKQLEELETELQYRMQEMGIRRIVMEN